MKLGDHKIFDLLGNVAEIVRLNESTPLLLSDNRVIGAAYGSSFQRSAKGAQTTVWHGAKPTGWWTFGTSIDYSDGDYYLKRSDWGFRVARVKKVDSRAKTKSAPRRSG
jgi:hypothetical protein